MSNWPVRADILLPGIVILPPDEAPGSTPLPPPFPANPTPPLIIPVTPSPISPNPAPSTPIIPTEPVISPLNPVSPFRQKPIILPTPVLPNTPESPS